MGYLLPALVIIIVVVFISVGQNHIQERDYEKYDSDYNQYCGV